MNHTQQSDSNSPVAHRWILVMLFLGMVGVIDASYLFSSYLSGSNLVCTIADGCNMVLSSSYASFAGVPLSLLGLIYYIVLSVTAFVGLRGGKTQLFASYLLLFVASVGFLISLLLVYLQIAVIEHVCEYCMLSALVTTSIWVISVIVFKKTTTSIRA